MVANIASETLTHSEIVPEDEQGANIWDILIQRLPVENPAKAERSGTQAKKMCKRRIKSMGMTTKTLTKLSEVQAVDD